jgi:hypothetical protein
MDTPKQRRALRSATYFLIPQAESEILVSHYSAHHVTSEGRVKLRRLIAGFSPRRRGFTPSSVHVVFVDKVALGQFCLRVLRFFLVSYHSTAASYSLISSARWTKGPLEAQFKRDIVSSHRSNANVTSKHNLLPSLLKTTTLFES